MKAGFIVWADRYVYTAFARDVARGVDKDWVRNMYGFAIKPDLTLYYSICAEMSLERICANRTPSFYEAGMDLKLSNNPYKSYVIFQNMVNNEYLDMVDEFGLVKIDADSSIHAKQVLLRQHVTELLAKKGINI